MSDKLEFRVRYIHHPLNRLAGVEEVTEVWLRPLPGGGSVDLVDAKIRVVSEDGKR